jgi:hypothetical protein
MLQEHLELLGMNEAQNPIALESVKKSPSITAGTTCNHAGPQDLLHAGWLPGGAQDMWTAGVRFAHHTIERDI